MLFDQDLSIGLIRGGASREPTGKGLAELYEFLLAEEVAEPAAGALLLGAVARARDAGYGALDLPVTLPGVIADALLEQLGFVRRLDAPTRWRVACAEVPPASR